MHVAHAKRGKTHAGKLRLVLVLLLIGRESGVRFFSQSQTVAMQNQSNCEITFDSELKTALLEWFSIECRNTKTKVITLTITSVVNNPMNQSELKANTCSRRQMWGNACRQVTIGFDFASDWLRN